jgi:type 1 glutamine amidotransferase
MHTRTLILTTLSLLVAPIAAQTKVLFLTKSAGYTHGVVKRVQRGKMAWAEHNLRKFAAPQFQVDCTQDCNDINADNLKNYAAVIFYTTGELKIPDAGMKAFFEFIENGGGFVGIHCATDTFYKNAKYGEMIGGYFRGHPWNQEVRILVVDKTHPATALLGDAFNIADEIYQFRNFDKDKVNVLLRLDPEMKDIGKGMHKKTKYYANAWSRDYGKGRVFYTALGHRNKLWVDRRFMKHLTSGIRWAMRSERTLAKAPKDAIVLFDGKSLNHWQHANGKKPAGFRVENGVMTVAKSGGSIVTTRKFRDFQMHLEFRTPSMLDKKGQARGNSGVYIQRRYEVQILDSHALDPSKSGCAALYRQRKPDANVCRKPGEWQAYDIWFTAARFDKDGKKTTNARITLIHNDVMVHDNVELTNKTGAGNKEGPTAGPILLQDHGNPVSYRNVWIIPKGE